MTGLYYKISEANLQAYYVIMIWSVASYKLFEYYRGKVFFTSELCYKKESP